LTKITAKIKDQTNGEKYEDSDDEELDED